MYSLDQVIYFLEQRQQTEDWNIRDAAIAYLKGYREVFPEYARMKLDAVKNDPLTWDELKDMEGKPIWVEHKLFKGWRLVGWQANEHLMNLVGSYSEQVPLFEDDCGVSWNAYRKEK